MERLTKKHYGGNGYYMACSEHCNKECFDCKEIDKIIDRLGTYEDTGLEPEEIERIVDAYGRGHTLRTESAERLEIVREIKTDRLRELAKAEQDGRLVVLDEPMRPLVWGDKEHDTILCPRCLCDLMGGFEYAPSCETVMFQCPHCGQPIKSDKAIDMEQSEAEAALSQKGGEAHA